jgi:hypothetical protein
VEFDQYAELRPEFNNAITLSEKLRAMKRDSRPMGTILSVLASALRHEIIEAPERIREIKELRAKLDFGEASLMRQKDDIRELVFAIEREMAA